MSPSHRTIEVDGFEVILDGDAEQVILMVHGWPDTLQLWDSQVQALSPTWTCARFNLPGYDINRPKQRARSLRELIALFARIADAVSPERPVVLMLHDWGCVFGLQYAMAHPHRVARLIAVDVGDSGFPAVKASQSLAQRWRVARYQLRLTLAWLLGGERGDRWTREMAAMQRVPGDLSKVCASMNYPYAMRWLGALGGMKQAVPPLPLWPTLFIWGTKKTMMFHSPGWLDAVAARADSKVVPMAAGHWMMVTRATEFNGHVIDWLQAAPTSN